MRPSFGPNYPLPTQLNGTGEVISARLVGARNKQRTDKGELMAESNDNNKTENKSGL